MGKARNKFNTESESVQDQRKLATKKYTIHDMIQFSPKTKSQKLFWDKWEDGVDLIFQIGVAGSGKTAATLWNMLYTLLTSNEYDSILIVRSPTPTVEIGFLKGDEEEKNEVYELPYRQLVNEMFKFNNSYDNLKALGKIQFTTTAFLRGQTWDRKLVLFDEFQSADFHELCTAITRVGEYSRIVFCGDGDQNDLIYSRGKRDSGFVDFIKIINKMNNNRSQSNQIPLITYKPEDIVRSGLVREFITAKYELKL